MLAKLLVLLGLLVPVPVLAQTTQPSTVDAVPVIPVQPAGDHWTPTNVIVVATVIVGLIAGTLIPAMIAYKKASVAESKATTNEAQIGHLQTTNERQQSVLDTVQQKLPPDPK